MSPTAELERLTILKRLRRLRGNGPDLIDWLIARQKSYQRTKRLARLSSKRSI